MSGLDGVRQLRSPSVAAVVLLAPAASAPADAARRSALTIAGAPAKRLRLCGAVHKTMSVKSGARGVAVVRSLPRGTQTLTVSRCGGGKWSRFKQVRIASHRVGHRVRVRLPRLAAGGYRLSGRGLSTVHVRVLQSALPALPPLLDRAAVRAPMVAFCDGPNGDGPHRADATKLPVDPRKLVNAVAGKKDGAVYYNAPWIPVRDAPGMKPAPFQSPTTCGAF